jgi:hypothetical protein
MGFQVTEVQKALKGIHYPASSDDLASTAEGNGATEDLVGELKGLGGSFDGPDKVMAALKGSLGGETS